MGKYVGTCWNNLGNLGTHILRDDDGERDPKNTGLSRVRLPKGEFLIVFVEGGVHLEGMGQ